MASDIFVGFLFAIGVLLYAYKGFSDQENLFLNLAAVSAFLVALFPMNSENPTGVPDNLPVWQVIHHEPLRGYIHGAAALTLFACIAYVSIFRSRDTLNELERSISQATAKRRYFLPTSRRFFEIAYTITGHAMWVLPALAVVAHFASNWILTKVEGKEERDLLIYGLEFAGIYAFALFWMVKTYEIHLSKAERKELGLAQSAAQTPPHQPLPPKAP